MMSLWRTHLPPSGKHPKYNEVGKFYEAPLGEEKGTGTNAIKLGRNSAAELFLFEAGPGARHQGILFWPALADAAAGDAHAEAQFAHGQRLGQGRVVVGVHPIGLARGLQVFDDLVVLGPPLQPARARQAGGFGVGHGRRDVATVRSEVDDLSLMHAKQRVKTTLPQPRQVRERTEGAIGDDQITPLQDGVGAGHGC